MSTTRRGVLEAGAFAALGGLPMIGAMPAWAASGTAADDWDSGDVAHLLPASSHDRLLIKASFKRALDGPPKLNVGGKSFPGIASDTQGLFWQFFAEDLKPGTEHRLSLAAADGRALCAPWTLSTMPAPEDRPQKFRLLVYSCSGGHDLFAKAHTNFEFLPAAVRQRLLKRALSFQPDALVANGDHVYWDLLAPKASPRLGANPAALAYARFDRSLPVLGTPNESALFKAAGEQITPLYGTLCRSTPVFFLQDDHDHFDNDEATDEAVTFPPDTFMMQAARATQRLWYPEFLPDPNRPAGLPGCDTPDRPAYRPSGLSESFGTLRYGRLAEVLLYDVRRTMTLAGPASVYVAPEVETWLKARAAARDVDHVMHVPSNPPGWSAGKWGEWYPDLLGSDGRLSVAKPKPYWQSGWLTQHDRLMQSLAEMPGRIPLVVSGDLHATAEGRMLRSGKLDFSKNPVVTVLPGTLGTSTGGWASEFRGVGPLTPHHLDMDETVKPIEENGFLIMDFTPESVVLRYFNWNQKTQRPEAIDTLEPFHTTTMKRA
ncbi:hypothetical protein [Methylobacterium brachythecii]|uniref:PhoD-like phosphatase metallophosphatase domain-containing protein n=1 Tax=Methylobacterium brachythecii TaxID=1176177 RepID=A0A7W6AIE6_9HYPH|nr:hypothetical protein [Methylobacterium brachythecii]MBB3901754.1 hypothetical protein [Methylobacterium brachythecii]GLS43889.1 hypothetical protein GCM10007884_18750 [Methylobacterium brachythecii]